MTHNKINDDDEASILVLLYSNERLYEHLCALAKSIRLPEARELNVTHQEMDNYNAEECSYHKF